MLDKDPQEVFGEKILKANWGRSGLRGSWLLRLGVAGGKGRAPTILSASNFLF